MRLKVAIRIILACGVLGLLLIGVAGLRAQQVTSIRGSSFRVQLETYPPPHETQIKTSLEGKSAEPQPGGRILFVEPKINRFATNGVLEFQIRSPECIFDIVKQTVNSTNMLQIAMLDGRFFMEGRGFLRATNGTIILSNNVHTIIRPPARPLHKP